MNDQKDFDFDQGEAYARRSDPPESQGAAAALRDGGGAAGLERLVLETLAMHPDGLTSGGLCRETGLGDGSISPRIKPLRRRGVIEGREDGNGKPIRRYDSRQPSRVWFLTTKGLLEVSE